VEQKRRNDAFYASLKFGEDGERAVAEWLIRRGYTVFTLEQFKNKRISPKARNKDGEIVFADMLGCHPKNKVAFLIECKRRTTWYKKDGKKYTGIPEDKWKEYKKLSSRFKLPLYMYWLQEQEAPTGLYRASLKKLGKPSFTMDSKDGSKRFVMWPVDKLSRVTEVSNLGL
jgi:hypothetical protein